MSKTGKTVTIAAGALVFVVAIALFVVLGQLGRIIERGVETVGPNMTGTDVSLGLATVSVFDGEGALRDLEIGNPKGFSSGDAFELGKIAIAVDVKSVTSDVVHIRSIVIDGPKVLAEFDAAGRNNLNTILGNVRAASARGGGQKTDGDGGAAKKLIIDEFKFLNAEVRALAPAFQVDKTLKMKGIELRNLGGKSGATPSAIANQVMRPIVDAAVQAATQEYLAAQREKLGRKAEEKLMEKIFK